METGGGWGDWGLGNWGREDVWTGEQLENWIVENEDEDEDKDEYKRSRMGDCKSEKMKGYKKVEKKEYAPRKTAKSIRTMDWQLNDFGGTFDFRDSAAGRQRCRTP